MPRYSEAQLRAAVASARSLSDVLRHFALRPAGGNHRQLRKWLDMWQISTDRCANDRPAPRRTPMPLGARKAARPPYEELVTEIRATSRRAVGRKYGVSDNAVRKWARAYEAERRRDVVGDCADVADSADAPRRARPPPRAG